MTSSTGEQGKDARRVASATGRRRERGPTDLSGHVDVSGHDAHLAATGVDDAGAVGACQARMRVSWLTLLCREGEEAGKKQGPLLLTDHARLRLALERVDDADLVELRDALGDGNNKSNLGLDGLKDSVGGEGRRDIDDGRVGLGLLNGLETLQQKAREASAAASGPGETRSSLSMLEVREPM